MRLLRDFILMACTYKLLYYTSFAWNNQCYWSVSGCFSATETTNLAWLNVHSNSCILYKSNPLLSSIDSNMLWLCCQLIVIPFHKTNINLKHQLISLTLSLSSFFPVLPYFHPFALSFMWFNGNHLYKQTKLGLCTCADIAISICS